MKKYLFFAGSNYDRFGGIKDYYGDFDEIEEAVNYFLSARDENEWDWYHIVIRDTLEIIREYKS